MAGNTPRSIVITEDNHGAVVTIVAVVLLVWMLCVYLARCYVRLRFTPWGCDDSVITVSTVAAIAQVAMICTAVHNGFGTKQVLLLQEQLYRVEQSLYCSQILYVAVLCLSKCSTSLLILGLTRTRPHQIMTYAAVSITTLWAVSSLFVISLRGDLTHPWTSWDQPDSSLYPRWIAIEVIGMVIEIVLIGLSVALVKFLQMKKSIKMVVVMAFFSRVLVIIPAILRLYYIRPSYNYSDPTFRNVYAEIITQVAMHYGLVAASIPCLIHFISPFDTDHMGSTSDRYSSNTNAMFPNESRASSHTSNIMLESANSIDSKDNPTISTQIIGRWKGKAPAREKIAMTSKSGIKARHGCRRETWTKRGVAGDSLRPDIGETITVIEHSPYPHMLPGRGDDHKGSIDDSYNGDRMVIMQTKEYEVHYEKAEDADRY